jgi:hypothetical protein
MFFTSSAHCKGRSFVRETSQIEKTTNIRASADSSLQVSGRYKKMIGHLTFEGKLRGRRPLVI